MAEKQRDESWKVIVILILVGYSFYFGIWWGIAAFVLGSVWVGWDKRHSGPFRTRRTPNNNASKTNAAELKNFHSAELAKIRDATTGPEHSEARVLISVELRSLRQQLEEAKSLGRDQGRKRLGELLGHYASERRSALRNGATSYSHPNWAAAAACESWLHALLGNSPEEMKEASYFANQLMSGKAQ